MDPVLAWSIGSTLFSGWMGKRSQDKQAAEANKYRELQYGYDKELYKMGNKKLDADWAFAYETYELQKANEEKIAQYTDAMNLKRYNYDLKIVKAQNESNKKAFQKSEQLYHSQLGFNNAAANAAHEDALIKQREFKQETIFKNSDAIVRAIEEKGKLAVTMQAGGSSAKAAQALLAAKGKNEALLAESLLSSNISTMQTLRTIARDKYGADLAAFANKMLEPGIVPDPIKPLPTPVADFQAPRPLEDFDYGPEPIKGVKTVGGSWLSVASSAIKGIADYKMAEKFG